MTGVLTIFNSWAPIALCWQYFNAHVEEQRVEVLVRGAGSLTELTVTWAVGVLADGAELPPLPFPSHPVGRAVARAAVRSELAVLVPALSV